MWRTLKHIGRTHRRKLIATFTLVGLENLLMLAYPIFGGWAIDLLRKYPKDLQFPNEIRKPHPKKR